MSVCSDPAVVERQKALSEAFGYWSIIRKGRRDLPPRVHKYKNEASARIAWDKLDVREGWALLVNNAGGEVAKQSGPWGVRSRW